MLHGPSHPTNTRAIHDVNIVSWLLVDIIIGTLLLFSTKGEEKRNFLGYFYQIFLISKIKIEELNSRKYWLQLIFVLYDFSCIGCRWISWSDVQMDLCANIYITFKYFYNYYRKCTDTVITKSSTQIAVKLII